MAEQIYLSNGVVRYVALRKLLLGENGVLSDEQGREDLITALEHSWLNFVDDAAAFKTVDGMLRALIATNEPEK